GHVDDVPTCLAVPRRLRSGGESGAVDHHHGAAAMNGYPLRAAHIDQYRPQPLVVRVGERGVPRPTGETVVERRLTSPGPVDQLVHHHEVTGADIRVERPGSERRQQRADAELAHGIDVCPIVDPVRWKLMPKAM